MNDYLQYVHNLKGVAQYDRFKPATRDAIVSVLLRQIENQNTLEKTILHAADRAVFNHIASYLDLKTYCRNIILTTDSSSYVDEVDFNNIRAIINLRQVNFTQHPNKLFRAVNTLLPKDGMYIGRVSSYNDRKAKIYRRFGHQVGFILWMSDFIINRVLPRLRLIDKLYYSVTNGKFHNVSGTEVLGRLVYCGFRIIDFREINGLSYFVAAKEGEPRELANPSYYPIVKLPRIGKDGKILHVYKFRTMHPYSEYLQEYMVMMHGYNDKGKPANDYRVTRWGSFMRKFWLDELPQLINVLKGEMKLVGIRPISWARYNEFPKDMQCERLRYKPGCVPPYVALNMPDDKGNIEAERIYFRESKKHPYLTDIRYFNKALYNIFVRGIRGA